MVYAKSKCRTEFHFNSRLWYTVFSWLEMGLLLLLFACCEPFLNDVPINIIIVRSRYICVCMNMNIHEWNAVINGYVKCEYSFPSMNCLIYLANEWNGPVCAEHVHYTHVYTVYTDGCSLLFVVELCVFLLYYNNAFSVMPEMQLKLSTDSRLVCVCVCEWTNDSWHTCEYICVQNDTKWGWGREIDFRNNSSNNWGYHCMCLPYRMHSYIAY